MKDYKKFMKELSRDVRFEIFSTSRRNTVKVRHKDSGELYSVHPADQAVRPLRAWILKHKN